MNPILFRYVHYTIMLLHVNAVSVSGWLQRYLYSYREYGAAGLAPTYPAGLCVPPVQVSAETPPLRVGLPLQAEGGQGEGGEAHWDLR